MSSTLFRIVSCFGVVAFLVSWTVTAQEPQARATLEPVGEEAFRVIAEAYGYDKIVPLDAKLVQRDEILGHIRDKIVFTGGRDERVVGYISTPPTESGPRPVVLLSHGIGGSKRTWWEDDGFESGGILTKRLLEAGFAVFALDAQYCGERTFGNDFETAITLAFRGNRPYGVRDMMIQSAMDYRRAMDYLETRSDIDAERIGMVGYSLGEMLTFYISAVDPRIKTAVAVATPLDAPHSMGLGASVAMENFAGAIDQSAFLMLMGRSDEWYSPEQAETVFGLIESPSKKLAFFDSGHRLPVEYTEVAVDWIKEHLR